jgi:DNA adenine methylase
MHQHGSKKKIGKGIAQSMAKYVRKNDIDPRFYCEPFCGTLGVFQFIPEIFDEINPDIEYLAGDINASLIKLWKSAQAGKWKPPTSMTKTRYNELYKARASAEKGFVGHQCAFGGIYFGHYTPKFCTKRALKNAGDKVLAVAEDMENVEFSAGKYTRYSNLKGGVIYCDPPYAKYNRYYDEKHNRLIFDHEAFWNWVRKMSKYNTVFVSEYSAPQDFKNIHKKRTTSHGSKNTEKLYVFNG